MKILLVSLVVIAVAAWQLNEHPFTLTLTPIEEGAPIVDVETVPPVAATTTTPTKPTPTTPRPTPGTTTTKPTVEHSTPLPPPSDEPRYAEQVADLVLQKTNIERAKNDLAELNGNGTLANIAHDHSADMQAKSYFSHEDSTGCDSSCRAGAAGYKWSTIGENIYMMSGYEISADAAAEKIVQGWMNSPGHRANILNSEYTQTGVGIVSIGEEIYATAVYATPR